MMPHQKETLKKHSWKYDPTLKWDVCRICGCWRTKIGRGGDSYYEYSRSKLFWSRTRFSCIDWSKVDEPDNDSIENFYEVK